jgi:two-component system, response regulator PdtaR
MERAHRQAQVLVVDDEILVRLDVADFLDTAGFDVVMAENAEDALCLLRDHADIDAVITDIQMPGVMDGLELTVAIAKNWPEIFVIVVSGVVTAPKMPSKVTFFRKPYAPAKIIELLKGKLAAR